LKIRTAALCLSLLLFISGCGSGGSSPAPTASAGESPAVLPSAESGTVNDYFPKRENVRCVYKGEGNEYASYRTYVDYAEGSRIQQRIDNGGTQLVRVIELSGGSAVCVYRRSECYYRENLLNRTGGEPEVLLKEPISVGNSWKLSDGRIRTISGIGIETETPAGAYPAVSVVTEGSGGKSTDYYAKDIGLIMTVDESENIKILSTLEYIEYNVPFVQSIRFYYPNINDGRLYYRDHSISFSTNDISRKKLEAAYKELSEGETGKVFSANTEINSLYLNDDGMVYLDLNGKFLTEMNAGSGYEAMILQCLANTFASYYGAEKLVLSIDGKPYESGHIVLGKGDYLSVKTDGCVELA